MIIEAGPAFEGQRLAIRVKEISGSCSINVTIGDGFEHWAFECPDEPCYQTLWVPPGTNGQKLQILATDACDRAYRVLQIRSNENQEYSYSSASL